MCHADTSTQYQLSYVLINVALVLEDYAICVTTVVASIVKSNYPLHWNLDKPVSNWKDVQKLLKRKFTEWELVNMFGSWNLEDN